MKYSVAASIFLAAFVAAQDVSQLPGCALACASSSVAQSGGCSQIDVGCLCRSSGYLTAYATCLTTTCTPAEAQTAATIGTQLCANAGVTLSSTPSPTATASNASQSSSRASSASSAASSVSSSAAAASSSVASSVSSAASASASSASSRASSASSSASSAASSLSSAASSAASSATSRAAAPTQGFAWEVLGLGAAAAAALL